jgi:sialic acid synthase SpsE
MARKGKPVILSTGACDIGEVQRAVHAVLAINSQLVVMQCNTNYTASAENFGHIHLRVLETYRTLFPDVILGLSDHTLGHATVLGAVTLGARVIEKHFTDDNNRVGPDHPFSMTPKSWREMVDRSHELQQALGSADKKIADNERQTAIVQRRCLRAGRDIQPGEVLERDMIDVLRPATPGAILPPEINSVIGARALKLIPAGKELRWKDLGE